MSLNSIMYLISFPTNLLTIFIDLFIIIQFIQFCHPKGFIICLSFPFMDVVILVRTILIEEDNYSKVFEKACVAASYFEYKDNNYT